MGSLLCDGIGNSVEIAGDGSPEDRVTLAFNILQAAGSSLDDVMKCKLGSHRVKRPFEKLQERY